MQRLPGIHVLGQDAVEATADHCVIQNCGSVPCGSLTQHFGKVGQGKWACIPGYTKTIVKSDSHKIFFFFKSN